MARKRALIFCVIYACMVQSETTGLRNALKLFSNDNSCYFEHYGKPLSEAEWIEGVDISTEILDVEPSFKKFYIAKSRNIRGITDVKINGREVKDKYIDILLVRQDNANDLELIIALGTGFRYYEEYETSDVMKVSVTFLCESGSHKSLEIRQKIIDTKNHNPQFIPNGFEFKVPHSIEANHLIGQITARDIDLTNSNISFNFRSTGSNTQNEWALLGIYQDKSDPKTFHAWFVTIANVSLKTSETFYIYAQDYGKPSRLDFAQVKLIPEEITTTTPKPTTAVPPPTTIKPPPTTIKPPTTHHPGEMLLLELASPRSFFYNL